MQFQVVRVLMLVVCAFGGTCQGAERASYEVSGTITSVFNSWGQSYSSHRPIRGGIDVLFDDNSQTITFENERLFVGRFVGQPIGNGVITIDVRSDPSPPEVDFSSAELWQLGVGGLTGVLDDSGEVFFHARPDGYFPPWECPPPDGGQFVICSPQFHGVGTDALVSADRSYLQFIRIGDFTGADGGRTSLYLEIRAVPEPSSFGLFLASTLILMKRRRHSAR